MLKNWRTSLWAILALIGNVLVAISAEIDGNPETIANWGQVTALLPIVVGLFLARDYNVRSEGTVIR
jgi:hypothetical protein